MQVTTRYRKLFYLGLSCLLLSTCAPTPNEIMLVNGAEHVIRLARVSIGGYVIEAHNVGIGAKWQHTLPVRRDSTISITIEFEMGQRLQKDVGYVTSGMRVAHEVLVTEKDIELRSTVHR